MEIYDNPLEELIYDCGGPTWVAKQLEITKPSVWGWINKGRLPFTDLTGETHYAEVLAAMQQVGTLTPVEIRRIGIRV